MVIRVATRVDRRVLAFSLTAAAYFGFLALDYLVLRLDSVVLRVFRELLTIPMILAVVAVFVFAMVRMLRDRRRVTAVNVGSAAILFAIGCLVWI